jgi:prophage antirepressor-like protein
MQQKELGTNVPKPSVTKKEVVNEKPDASPEWSELENLVIINESGLYNPIFRSKKLIAKIFKRWVTHEVDGG